MPKTEKWIQKATANMQHGAHHKQLGIPASKTIPTKTLENVVNTGAGEKANKITVTPLLKKRVNFALNIRKHK
jgi:hypothetical protein